MKNGIYYSITPLVANQYSSLFKSLNQKIDQLFEHLNNDFLVTTNKVKRYNSIAREILASGDLSQELQGKIKTAMKSFGSIIIELQYHDIIRQKLEHIHTIELELSREFDAIYEKGNKAYTPYYTLVMYDLVVLAYNQIKQVREEYLAASTKIQRQLRSLWADREISHVLRLFLFNTAENLKNVLEALDLIIKMHEKIKALNVDFDVKIEDSLRIEILTEIKSIYTMDSERHIFNETFGIKEEEVVADEDDIFF